MLVLEHVTRAFGGLQAVGGVSMTVAEGQVTGLIGPNGAGKTTLINTISGLDHPTSGRITFEGTPIHKAPPHRITRLGVARTYQNIRLFPTMTALENLLLGQHGQGRAGYVGALLFLPGYRREERAQRNHAMALLARFGLGHAAHLPAASLPYGDQRRLEMARALATRPRLLLLDEPAAGMNHAETHALGEQILRLRDEGLTVLVIEHDMALIGQVCDHVYVLNFGQLIAQGSHAEVQRDTRVIEAYLGREEAPR